MTSSAASEMSWPLALPLANDDLRLVGSCCRTAVENHA